MVLWDTSLPSPRSAGFLNKVSIPCPHTLSLDILTCYEASSMSLGSVTGIVPGNKDFKSDSCLDIRWPKARTRVDLCCFIAAMTRVPCILPGGSTLSCRAAGEPMYCRQWYRALWNQEGKTDQAKPTRVNHRSSTGAARDSFALLLSRFDRVNHRPSMGAARDSFALLFSRLELGRTWGRKPTQDEETI